MDISSLKDENGYIKIAAMDHRGSLQKAMSESKMSPFKELLAETFLPYSTAILVDPHFGGDAIKLAKEANKGLLLSREESGYTDTSSGRATELSPTHNAQNLHEMGATAIKLLLYYNSDASNAQTQREIAKSVFEESVEVNLPLLIEPITYQVEGTSYHKGDAIIKAIKDLRDYCDVLKLEFPIDVENLNEDEMEEAIPYLEMMTTESQKEWVLLSRGMKFNKFEKAVEMSKDAGASGYAVGRAVWQEAVEIKEWESITEFIKNTAKDRMAELAKIYHE